MPKDKIISNTNDNATDKATDNTIDDFKEEEKLSAFIKAAAGRIPADLVIRGSRIFNVFTGQIFVGDLAVSQGKIAGLGPAGSYDAPEIVEEGGFLFPGFIDSHLHIESSMASPQSLAVLLAGCGVTTAVADPHEIVNVAGLAGLDYFLAVSQDLPMDFFFVLPSCVPATDLEKGGATVTARDLKKYFAHPRVLGLGEMMNYPGVIWTDPEVIKKISAAARNGSLIDGHSPEVTGLDLNAYRAAGISSDHEATTLEEANERLSLGFRLMIREGTAARNLKALWPAVTEHNSRFCLWATDDRHAQDLVSEGSINYLVRLAQGMAPDRLAMIINMASINAAEYFGLKDRGALAPGYLADMALYDDLLSWQPRKVWKRGKLVSPGQFAPQTPAVSDKALLNSLHIAKLQKASLKVPAIGSQVRVIGLRPGEIVTDSLIMSWEPKNGFYEANPEQNILKIAVWNRYDGDGQAKVGFLKGLGLKAGALAQTISHDSHQLVAAGVKDEDILLAAQKVIDLNGGLAAAKDDQILGSLALPLGGLMSHEPVAQIARALEAIGTAIRPWGISPDMDPFLVLGFMSLPVIPHLKLTSSGLVENFKFVPVVLP
jgi:adenine deaminase